MTKHRPTAPANGACLEETDRAYLIDGLIVDGSRGLYRVQTDAGALLCAIRGRLRKELEYARSTSLRRGVQRVKVKEHDPVAVGDRVHVRPTGGGNGVIEEVVAGEGGAFTRRDPDKGGGHLRSVAGIDQLVAVFAARDPAPHLRLLDRLLVLAEAQQLDVLICLNKADLGVEPWLERRLAVYRALGYPVVLTSAAAGLGVDDLREHLAGRTSAFLGPSGVGKSSLLNALRPGLAQRVSEVSDTTHKGRHTTTGTRLEPLDGAGGGFIADTAGIRALALTAATTEQLDRCFREFRAHLGACPFSDCTHVHEPGCAVRAAVSRGELDAARYDSYCRLHGSGPAGDEWEEDIE